MQLYKDTGNKKTLVLSLLAINNILQKISQRGGLTKCERDLH
jgi:hypothetical protein